MNAIAELVPYLLIVLGVVAVYAAGFLVLVATSPPPAGTWRPWLLLTAGATACLVAAALL